MPINIDPCCDIENRSLESSPAGAIFTFIISPLLHRLFLDHDIIFIEKFQEKFKLVLNTFENIMENGAFAPKEQMLHFP